MTTTDQDEPGRKPRQRSSKAGRRGQKPAQQLDQRDQNQFEPLAASTDTPAGGAAALENLPLPAAVSSIAAAAATDHDPISIQTIANAYRDYTRKSLQESGSFVEKLMGVRSFDKAMEVQTEFARQAYANFIAESQKVWDLYSQLAKQTFRPWKGFAAKAIRADH
jgi:hypothetical protein